MTISVLRTADAWWVKTATGATKIDTAATTTAELLADRAAIEAAADESRHRGTWTAWRCVSPVTRPCRVVAQMTNFESHVKDAGMDPTSIPLTFFRKASGVDQRPVRRHRQARRTSGSSTTRWRSVWSSAATCRSAPPSPRRTSATTSPGWSITNDVSARDIQLPQTQFYEAKSYPTFTPVGPELVLLDADELKRFGDLRLRLSVNGDERQNSVVEGDMIYRPLRRCSR